MVLKGASGVLTKEAAYSGFSLAGGVPVALRHCLSLRM